MAENKKSFILYCDQKGIWDKLTDEQAGKLIKHIISYVNDENPKTDDFIIELAFEPIKQQLKRDLKKWERQYNQRVEAGKRSAESRKRNSTAVDGRSHSSTVNVNDNVTVNVNGNEDIIILGVPEEGKPCFKIKRTYLTDNNFIVYGQDGYEELMAREGVPIPKEEMPHLHKFLRDKNGCIFEGSPSFVINSFKHYIKKQFA